jgi:hypothetical protein
VALLPIVGSAIATYAAVVSTLSLAIAVKVYRAGNPNVEVHWEYQEPSRKLSLSILNTGRGDVTISAVDIFVVHETIFNRSRSGRYFNLRMDTVDHVPNELWLPKEQHAAIPFRLASNSLFSMDVKNGAISLPSDYPLEEILLKFVARFPGGKKSVYLRGDVLRHFIGIDPDRPIALPSPGSVPSED